MDHITYDLLVAGGGTAGSAAAIAAARRGLRVLLVEEQNSLGGVSTSGGVGEWFASLEGMGNIFTAVQLELKGYGVFERGSHLFNPEYLKTTWQMLAEQAGVDILYHATVCGVEKQDGKVTKAEIVCCSKKLTVEAAYYIDATGEGDLCALAGAEFMQGDPEGHRVLHMSLVAWMYDTGVNQSPYLPAGIDPIGSRDELPGLGSGRLVDRNRLYMNSTKVMGHDPTDPFSLSRAEMEARRQLARIVHYVQTHGYPTYALASSGSTIGIREGRRIVGDYVLRHEEVLERVEPLDFNDGITVATCQVDFHSLTKPGDSGWRQRVEPYGIPYRCLLPKGLGHVAVAGKCISVDQVVHSSCRMTPTCCAMGQAAGTAAALAMEGGGIDLREVPLDQLRSVLTTDGLELDPRRHKAFAPHNTRLDADDAGVKG